MTSDHRATLTRMLGSALFKSELAAIAAALGTCGDCAHHDDTQVMLPSLVTYCTNRLSNYNGLQMERTSRCERWSAARLKDREARA